MRGAGMDLRGWIQNKKVHEKSVGSIKKLYKFKMSIYKVY